MRFRKLGQSDLQVSVVGLGTWAIGGDSNWGESNDALSIKTIQEASSQGITLIDTAPAYGLGHAEKIVGEAIKGHREDYFIETKCGLVWDVDPTTHYCMGHRDGIDLCRDLSPDGIMRQAEQSLQRLQTDHIDLYVTHWQAMAPNATPIEETMGALQKLKEQGIIRSIGISNVTPEQIRMYAACGEIAVVQQRYSMLNREVEENGILAACEELGISLQAYSPLERGLLTGKVTMETPVKGTAKMTDPWFEPENRKKVLSLLETFEPIRKEYGVSMASLVVAWTAARNDSLLVLCGARKPEQLCDNVQGGDVILEAEDLKFMTEQVRMLS